MKLLCLAVTLAVALMLSVPAMAGTSQHNYKYGPGTQKTAPSTQKRRNKGPQRRDGWQAYQAEQARKECRMFAFKYWRYHPDYQHCRYN